MLNLRFCFYKARRLPQKMGQIFSLDLLTRGDSCQTMKEGFLFGKHCVSALIFASHLINLITRNRSKLQCQKILYPSSYNNFLNQLVSKYIKAYKTSKCLSTKFIKLNVKNQFLIYLMALLEPGAGRESLAPCQETSQRSRLSRRCQKCA